MSTIQVINAKHPSSASNNIVLDNAGNATFANNVTVTGNMTSTGMVVPSSSFLRNRIINGDMRIDQRNAGASVTLANASNSFAVDRFRYYRDFAATTVTAQRSTVAPAGFTNSLLTTIVTGAATSSGSELQVSQVIEGFNVADLGWCTSAALAVTLSFWVRCSRTGTFSVTLQSNGGAPQQSYVTTYTVSAANTWEYKTVSVVGPTSGTFNAENGAGISVVFDLGSGSSFETSSLNSWVSGNRYSAAGAVKLSATTGATLHLTGVQLEVGTAATPFERRQFGQELALCQRYYEVGRGFATSRNSDDVCSAAVHFKATKRAVPTMVWTANMGQQPQPQYQAVDSAAWFAFSATSAASDVNYTATAEL